MVTEWKPRQFAALIGVSVKTLQRWDKAGFLVAGRTKSGRRVYSQRHLAIVQTRQQAYRGRKE